MDEMPKGKIVNVSISRLICGGNPFGGYAHSRDLAYVGSLMNEYFSEKKILETLAMCEENGINTVITSARDCDTDNWTTRLINRYWKEDGGKIQWLAQCVPDEGDLTAIIDKSVDNGAVGVFIQGGSVEQWIKNDRAELIDKSIDRIHHHGLIAGIAGHSLQVPVVCESLSVDVDFYVKTLHHCGYWSATPKENRIDFNVDCVMYDDHDKDHDNIWCINPDEVIEFMAGVKKPWIAFKVMAAGAIQPREGFKYAFANGADFVLAGMFDFQVAEDVQITKSLLAAELARKRPWRA